jgi:hypothetical protein
MLNIFGDGQGQTPEPVAAVAGTFTPKWTEGEWSWAWDFDENEEDTIATTRPDGNMQAIGVAFQSWHPNNGPVIDKAEAQANGQVMAASKRMYEALSRVAGLMEIWEAEGSLQNAESDLYAVVLSALKKARGEA